MATYTNNYAWTKPSGSDQVDVSVLNDNLDSQDSIMHDAFLNMAEPFSELSTYSVGDIVLYGTKTYKCRVAVTTAGSWTGSTNWEEYKLSEGGGASGGEVKNLDNGMLSHSTDSSYITVNLDVALTAGKEYKITIRDPYYNYVDTKQIVWVPSAGVTFAGNGGGPYVISLTQTTVSLTSYSGQGWRDIYCDIVSDFETVTAAQTTYDNTTSELTADNVQGAVDELAEKKADKSDIAPEFNTTTAYAKGDLCYHEGTLYEFNQAHAAGAWNASHVAAVNNIAATIGIKIKNFDVTVANGSSDFRYDSVRPSDFGGQIGAVVISGDDASVIKLSTARVVLSKTVIADTVVRIMYYAT